MTDGSHQQTEQALTVALAAAADGVAERDLAPSSLPGARLVGASAPRLLRTRRGVAALAVTAIASGGVGAAAAAALPGDDAPAPGATSPTSAGAPAPGRPDPRQLDVDGDGEIDPVRVRDGRLVVRLSRTDTVDRTRLRTPNGRLLALHRTGDLVAAVIVGGDGGGPKRDDRYLGVALVGERGFAVGDLSDVLGGVSVAVDRLGPARLNIVIE